MDKLDIGICALPQPDGQGDPAKATEVRALPDGSTLAVLATGSELAFDPGSFNDTSHLVVSTIANGFEAHPELSIADRFGEAFKSAKASMNQRGPVLNADWPHELWPDACVVCAFVRDGLCWIAWRGGHEALWVRNGRAIQRTNGHTVSRLRERRRLEEGPGGDTVIRALQRDEEAMPEVTPEPFELQTGDRLVLYTQRFLGEIEEDDSIEALTSSGSARQAALTLANGVQPNFARGLGAIIMTFEG